jgi:hypothetical protein
MDDENEQGEKGTVMIELDWAVKYGGWGKAKGLLVRMVCLSGRL